MNTLIETPELDKIKPAGWLEPRVYTSLQKAEIDNLIGNHFWITAKRKKISVTQMSTDHIQNCITCLLGLGRSIIPAGYLGGRTKWLTIFRNELQKRQ